MGISLLLLNCCSPSPTISATAVDVLSPVGAVLSKLSFRPGNNPWVVLSSAWVGANMFKHFAWNKQNGLRKMYYFYFGSSPFPESKRWRRWRTVCLIFNCTIFTIGVTALTVEDLLLIGIGTEPTVLSVSCLGSCCSFTWLSYSRKA